MCLDSFQKLCALVHDESFHHVSYNFQTVGLILVQCVEQLNVVVLLLGKELLEAMLLG